METQSYFITSGLKKHHEVIEIIYKGEESRFKYFRKLKSRIKKVIIDHPDIDMIHLNDGLMAFITSWLPKYTDIPIIITFHGLDLIFPQSLYQASLKKFIKSNCYAICVSQSTYDQAIKRGFLINNTIHIDNGVDHSFSSDVPKEALSNLIKRYQLDINPNQDRILVSIGRAVPRKGFSWFVDNVMPKLDENVKYIVIGPNNVSGGLKVFLRLMPSKFARFLSTLMGFTTDYHRAQQAIETQKLEDRVFFLNGIPFKDLVNFLSNSSMMVMPNVPFEGDMEGFGLVILEANICKKYVLASNIEGITSAIHAGQNGILLPTKDAEAWINSIYTLLSDMVDLDKKGNHAASYVKENFGWQKMVDKYIAYFEQIHKMS